MDCSYLDGGRSYIHNINAKGYKLSNDTAFVWLYRLRSCQCYMHEEAPFWWISEFLDFDLLTHANRPSWMNITKDSVFGLRKRAFNLLTIIHVDVCGINEYFNE